MKSLSRITLLGIALVTLCPLGGLAGTIWGIYRSFGAMVTNESAGIGAVGGGLELALVFTIFGLLGTSFGVILILLGTRKSNLP